MSVERGENMKKSERLIYTLSHMGWCQGMYAKSERLIYMGGMGGGNVKQ